MVHSVEIGVKVELSLLSTVTVTKAGACTLCIPRHVPELSLMNALLINLNAANMQLAIR